MKKLVKIVLSLMVLSSFFISCNKDDDKDPFLEFTKSENFAPYVRVITDKSLLDVTQLDGLDITFTVSTPGNNVSTWTVWVRLNGSTTTDFVQLLSVSSFPETFTYTVSELASKVGVDIADIAPGDKFEFSGVSTGADGSTLTADDLGPNLFGQPEQRNAYDFAIKVSCPELVLPVNPANNVGPNVITVDEWADYSIGDTIQVEQGSASNEIWIRQYDNPFISNPGTAYMILTIDVSTGNIVVSSNEAFDYGQGPVGGVSGTGFIDGCGAIHIFTVYDLGVFGIYGTYAFVIEPQ